MKNLNTFTVPTRKNQTLDNLTFHNDEALITFENENGELRLEVQLTKELFNGIDVITITSFTSFFPQIEKLINKLEISKFDANDFDNAFYNIQKRLKGFVRNEVKTEAPKKEVAEVVKEEVKEVKVPKKVAKQVKTVVIERPKSVGLEAQLQDMVFNALESDFTTQTLQNKMIELGIEPNRTEIVVKKAGEEPKNVGVQHREFKKILKIISAGVNTAIVGPAGSGKTTAIRNIATALSLPFYSKSVSAQTGSHEFFGYQDANGNYVRTLFREAYENGGVFLLDEFDAGNPNVLASMNQATSNGECAFADGMIKKHEDFVIVMAGNTWGHGATSDYVGRNPIDKATLDRFAFLYFDYDENFEMQLATNKDWCKEVQAIRKRVFDKKVKTIVSPRATFDGAKLLSAGLSVKEVKQLLIYKGLEKDEVNLIK